MRIIVYHVKILLSSQKMALVSKITQAILSLTFKLCLDFVQLESLNPIPFDVFFLILISAFHLEMPSSCHF